MIVKIISPTRVEIDGKDSGHPLDVFERREDLRPALRQAFIDWHVGHVIWEQQIQKEATDRTASLAKIHAEKIAALEADLAILGTKEEAQKMRASQRRAELLKELAMIDDTSSESTSKSSAS